MFVAVILFSGTTFAYTSVVFHRILEFLKNGDDFYQPQFFCPYPKHLFKIGTCHVVMKKSQLLFLAFLPLFCFAQEKHKLHSYIAFHVDATMYDRTRTNNAGGFGGGLETYLLTNSKFRPTLAVSGDAFGGTKEMYLTSDGRPIYAKSTVVSILAGSTYQASERVYINLAAGPSFFNSDVHMSLRPTIGVYFPANRQFVFKTSFTHVWQHDDISNEPFGFLNFGLGIRLF